MPPPPLPSPGTHKLVLVPNRGTNLIDWNRDVAELQSSQIVAGITLGDDTVAAAAAALPPPSIETTAFALAGDTIAALGTMQTSASAAHHLIGDLVTAAAIANPPGAIALVLAGDVVFATARALPFAHPALTLAGDVVRAVSISHDVTTGEPALVLAGDVITALGTAAASSVTAPALVLAGDTLAVPATSHPITTATAGSTGLGIHLGDDAIEALEGRSWALVNHNLGPDLITAAGDVVMPPADTSVALTLADDVIRADPEAFPPVATAAALVLADDLVNVNAVAFRTAYADPFAAIAATEAL